MPQMNLNTKFSMELSLKDISEFEKLLKERKKQLPQMAQNIVREVSKIGLQDNYKSTELLPVEYDGSAVSGGIRTTDEKDTYKEFGTGIVGSNSPHLSEVLQKAGWKYDVNEHGEKGWVYPKGDGTYGWTRGLPAQKNFYNAMKKMEDSFQEIAKKEFQK